MTIPDPQDQQIPEPPAREPIFANSLTSVDISVDAVGDTTVRPIRSPVLRQTRPTRARQERSAESRD